MKRDVCVVLENFLSNNPFESNVIIIEGARQVGKTYLVKDSINGKDSAQTIAINFEKEPDLRLEVDSTQNFEEFTKWLEQKKGFKKDSVESKIVFFDEAQESEKIGSYVRFMKEEWRSTKTILTGSSMTKLFSGETRVPVGRIEYLTVWPFNFIEFIRCGRNASLEEFILNFNHGESIPDFMHRDLLKLFDDYLLVGGMPEVVKTYYDGGDFTKILRFLIASEQDDFLRKEEKIKNLLFLDALKGVSNHVGMASKYTHVSPTHYEAKKIIELLKKWYLIIEVEQKGCVTTQTQFNPKRYVYDLGILRLLREVAIPRISAIKTLSEKLRTPLGGLIENAVILNMMEGNGGFFEVSGWKRNSNDAIEVDFIHKNLEKTIPIEVKAALNVTNRHAKNIRAYLKEFELDRGILISLDKPRQVGDTAHDITNIPAYLVGSPCYRKLLSGF